ncbi:MAG TPA: hypothetical protein VG796_25615 [Verrucomicrobiales bacterium]|nr:hypothetical protein [Verrucomicrobiales bacterium]
MSVLNRIVPLALFLAVPVHGQEPNEKAARYFETLQKRPVPGPVFDRFVDAWLDTDTLEHLERWLESRVKAQPSAAGHQMLALFHVRQGSHAKAVEQYSAALKLEPGNAAMWQQKAMAESRLLEFDHAIASLEKGLAEKPAAEISVTMRQLLGRLLSRAGRSTEALVLWQKLMEERPGDEALREDVLDLQLAEGLFDAAVQTAGTLVERASDPYKNAMRRLQLADVLERAGRTDTALAEWERCLADSGADSWLEKEVLARLDRAFRRDDNLTGLRKHLDGIVQRQPHRQGLQRARVKLLAELGEKSAAVEASRATLALAPGDRAMRDEFIALLVEAGRHDEAVAQVNELVKQAPADRDLLLKLASLKLQGGDKAGCLAAVQEYEKVSGADEAARLRAAALLEKAGLTVEHIARLQAAAREFPASAPVSQALASALHKARRGEEAVAEWKRQAATASGTALLDIARSMSAHGEDEAAWELLAAKAGPNSQDAPLLNQLCQLAERLNRADEALPMVRRLVGLAQSAPDMEVTLELASRLIKRAGQGDDVISSIAGDAGVADLCLLAELMEQRGDSAAAEAALQRVSKAAPELAASQMVRLYRLRQAWPQAMEAGAQLFNAPGGKKAATAQMLADLAQRARNPEEALKWTREWRKLSPGAAPAVLAEARLLRLLGKEDESLKVLRLASGQFEENREIREELARACRDAGRTNDALSIYAGLYEQAPDMVQKLKVVREWAETAQEANRLPELIEQFEERRRQNRAGTGPLLSLAEIYAVTGDREKQRYVLTEAARIRPEDADLALMLASMLEEDDFVPQAIETLKTALPHDKSGRVRQRLAKLHLIAGNQSEGMKLLEETTDGSPPDAGALESLAVSLADTDPPRALELLRQRVQADPEDYRLRYLLALLLMESGEEPEALREWTRLLTVKQECQAVTSRRGVPLLNADAERRLQQLTGAVPDEILTALRTHETAISAGPSSPAYYYSRQSYAAGRLDRVLPGSLAELQALTVSKLSSAFAKSPAEIREAAEAALKREGREPLVELLSKLPQSSMLARPYGRHRESSDEPFPRIVNDTGRGLHALLMLESTDLKVQPDVCQEVWTKWRDTFPDFALAAGLAGVGESGGVVEAWEKEVIGRLEKVDHPSLLVLSGVGRYLAGDGFGRGDAAETARVLERIVGWLESGWMGAPALDDVRRKMVRSLVETADKDSLFSRFFSRNAPETDAVLARVLTAEWSREERTKPGAFQNQWSPSSVVYSSGTAPEGFLSALSWPPRTIPGVSPLFAGGELIRKMPRPAAGRLAPLVKAPALRAWLEDHAADAGHPLPSLTKLASDPSAEPAALAMAAVSASEVENYDEASRFVLRALERPLTPEMRRLLNASLIVWAEDAMAAAGSPLHNAAREAALRLRREAQTVEDKLELAEAMEALGLNREASTLVSANNRFGGSWIRRFANYGMGRETGAHAILKDLMQLDSTDKAAIAGSVARHLRRHARYLLSPAGWLPEQESRLTRYRTDDDKPVSLEALQARMKDKGGVEKIIAALEPAADSGAGHVSVFAVMNEVLGNRSRAVELYHKALSAGATDPGVRVRLAMLLWASGDQALTEEFVAVAPAGQAKLLEYFLPLGKKEPAEKILRVAAMAQAALDKRDPALTGDFDWLNHLATWLEAEVPIDASFSIPKRQKGGLFEPVRRPNSPAPDETSLTKAREWIAKRDAAHNALCRGMLNIPGCAALAFSRLQALAPADADLAQEAITAFVSESRSGNPRSQMSAQERLQLAAFSMMTGETGLRPLELPGAEPLLNVVLDAAVKQNRPELLRDALASALQGAGSTGAAERVKLLSDLYFNPAEQADGVVRRLIGTSGDAAWSSAIRGLVKRKLNVDLSALLVSEVNRARSRPEGVAPLTDAVVDYCDWQCAGGHADHARSVLVRIVEVLAGSGKQRPAAFKAAFQNRGLNAQRSIYTSFGSPGGMAPPPPPALTLMEILRRLIAAPRTAFTALDVIYAEIMPQLSAQDGAALVIGLEMDNAGFTKAAYFSDPDKVEGFFAGSPMLADVEKFRSYGGATGVFTMVIKALQGMSVEERKHVAVFLNRQRTSFGRDLLQAASADRWSSSPMNAAAPYLEKLKSLSPSAREELVELLSEMMAGRDRGNLTDSGISIVKWVQQEKSLLLNTERTQSIEDYLNPRVLSSPQGVFGSEIGETGGTVLETAVKGLSPRAYDVVRRTASLARTEAPVQVALMLSGRKASGAEMFALPPDRSAFRLGVLTNTLCMADRRTPLFDEHLRLAIPRSAKWITEKLTGSTEERLSEFVRMLSPCVKAGEACVMLEAFPMPVTVEDTPENRAALRTAAIAWADGPAKSLPRQDIVREIAAAARLEQFVESHAAAVGIADEAALPPEQAHYLSVMKNEALSLSARLTVASVLADFAGPWLEPPLVVQAAAILDKVIATRRPLDVWQRQSIALAVGRSGHSSLTDAAAKMLVSRLEMIPVDSKRDEDRREAKVRLLLSMKDPDNAGLVRAMAQLQEKGGDPEVLAMVLRSGQEARIRNIVGDAETRLYQPEKISNLETFDPALAKALETAAAATEKPFARAQVVLAVNSLPSGAGVPGREERFAAIAAGLPKTLEELGAEDRGQILELLAQEPGAALGLEKYYLGAVKDSDLESLARLNAESVQSRPLKMWMVLLSASAAQADLAKMTERFDGLRQLGAEAGRPGDNAPNALLHLCAGIAHGWPQWEESKRAAVKDWLVQRRKKGTLLPVSDEEGELSLSGALPEPLLEALGWNGK